VESLSTEQVPLCAPLLRSLSVEELLGDPAPVEPDEDDGWDEECEMRGELRGRFLFLPIIQRVAEIGLE